MSNVEVPDACFESKPWFPEFPSREIVSEIRAFIKKTGRPWMWRGHTHAPPPDDRQPVYVEVIELPEKFVKLGYLAPCPRCAPKRTKWKKGVIAWFPEEYVIRLLGPRCFEKLNPEAHRNEMDAMRARRRHAAQRDYLLKHHERLLRGRDAIVAAEPVARDARTFWQALRYVVADRANLDLWQHVQRGELMIWEDFRERAGGAILRRQVRLALLHGHMMLAPTMKNFVGQLRQCIIGLAVLDQEDWASFVDGLPDKEREETARLISRSLNRGHDVIEAIRDLQQFVRTQNIATLRNWGYHTDTVFPIAVRRNDTEIMVGRSENAMFRVPIPVSLEEMIENLAAPPLDEDPLLTAP